MPSCRSMSAWSSRASWSRRARSSGLIANGFGGADGDGTGGACADSHAGSRARARRAQRQRRFFIELLLAAEAFFGMFLASFRLGVESRGVHMAKTKNAVP